MSSLCAFRVLVPALALLALLPSPAAADLLLDDFNDNNHTAETWDGGQWLSTAGQTSSPTGGTALRVANTLGVFDIFFVSDKATSLVAHNGGFAYQFGSDGITPSTPNNTALRMHALVLSCGFNRSALSDLTTQGYVRVKAWHGGSAPSGAKFFLSFGEAPETSCPSCETPATIAGPWIDPDGAGPLPAELGFDITATPTSYVFPLSSFAVDPIFDAVGTTQRTLSSNCAGCAGAPGAASLDRIATFSAGYIRKGATAGGSSMTATFTIDDVILSVNEPAVAVSGASVTVTEVGGGSSQAVTLALDARPSHDVTIALAASDATEATVSPASLTFTSANWDTPQQFTVAGVEDGVTDGDQNYTLDFKVTSDDDYYAGLSLASLNGTTEDNGVPVEISGIGLE